MVIAPNQVPGPSLNTPDSESKVEERTNLTEFPKKDFMRVGPQQSCHRPQ